MHNVCQCGPEVVATGDVGCFGGHGSLGILSVVKHELLPQELDRALNLLERRITDVKLCLILDVLDECLPLLLESFDYTILYRLKLALDPLLQIVLQVLLRVHCGLEGAKLAKRDKQSLFVDQLLDLLYL